MKKDLLLIVAVILSLSCVSSGPEPDAGTVPPAQAAATPAGVPDSEIGLAPGTAFEQPPQAPIAFSTVDPGESEVRARPNAEFPPVIPHSIADFEIITRSENPCMDCHSPEAAEDFDAIALPPSHQVDLRRAPGIQGDTLSGTRWVCTSCHVAQTDAEALVGNTS